MSIFTCLRNSFLFGTLLVILGGCAINSDFEPKKSVKNFNIYEFSGSWYEIANLDENLDEKNIKINFSIDKKDNIKIVKNYMDSKNSIAKREYSAKIVNENNNTILEVFRFLGVKERFSIAKIDGYKYAMLYGGDKIHILSRTKTLPELMKVVYLNHAKKDGYDVSKIQMVIQE
ncbi:lipocalin family protein [Campylobacter blaseri]|uniref:lipocalin family protein n=1 Tax=Campylobacter blaseri TaxID=2042961 RepID=UPI0012FFE681|nr:lipocalin family protein [Campylobacter blaseri]